MSESDKPNVAVVLLRGINVGKAKRIAMADLRSLFADLGYLDVRTVLNSGNVVFQIADPATDIPTASRIEDAVLASCGVKASVIILTADAFRRAMDQNPLANLATDPSRLLVAFLSDPSAKHLLRPLLEQEWGSEAIALGESVAYLWCPDGVLKSKLPSAVGKAVGDAVTMRNWTTVGRIHRLLGPAN